MPLIRDLGQVSAVYFGVTSPQNTSLIWIDTSNGLFLPKTFDPTTQAWVSLSAAPILIHNQIGNYTVNAAHLAHLVRFDGTAFRLPSDASVALPVGFWLIGQKTSTNATTTVVADTGVTIQSANNALRPFRQFSTFTVIKIGANTWTVSGDLIV